MATGTFLGSSFTVILLLNVAFLAIKAAVSAGAASAGVAPAVAFEAFVAFPEGTGMQSASSAAPVPLVALAVAFPPAAGAAAPAAAGAAGVAPSAGAAGAAPSAGAAPAAGAVALAVPFPVALPVQNFFLAL